MISAKQIIDSVNKGKSSRSDHFIESLNSAKLNKKFKAWQWLYEDLDASEQRRPRITNSDYSALNGVPMGFKDIFNSIDGTTEMGSEIWKGHKAGNDARIISMANEAGASIIGKTKTAEFAVHHLPDVYNPWDIERTTGTSSSGSAVAVLTGDVPVAFGTQTAGSISRPASFCGVIGFKPTFGIFPRTGVLKTCDPFDTLGYFCSFYEDVELVFNSMRLRGSNYPIIEKGIEFTSSEIKKSKEIVIGNVVTDATDSIDPEIEEASKLFLESLPTKYKIETCDLTNLLSNARELYELIYHKSLSYYFTEEREAGTDYSDIMKEIFAIGDKVSPSEYIEAISNLDRLRTLSFDAFSRFNLLVSPTTSSVAPYRNKKEIIDSSLFWSMLHLPLVSLPLFQSKESGLPFGLQVVGARKYSDQYLFDFIRDMDLAGTQINRPKL